MAHYGHQMAARPAQPAVYGNPIPVPAPAAPAGTFAPGTKIQVGSHRVIIQKYLSEGGFAHVYLVKLPKPDNGTDMAVLKRVAVPDKEALRGMRIEVETMKRLKGHKPIVTYMDSHASELRGGGYEVFLLMEYCNGGGLIDFMNTRLQHRLTEPEILQIFTDIAEGVACMHYLKPPLLHRDLKVENVLISSPPGSKKRFKLCDFGSASAPKPAPQTTVECRLLDEDVQKHTTMQYRSPEMIDVYRKQPIDEKSDIWALGVLLYKLCYYTTPFEEQGQLAILNASYKFHSHPVFSDRLKKLIASMLRENQQSRPNIYQVLKESCAMQGREVPVHDIYSGRTHSEARSDPRPSAPKPSPTPAVGATFSPPPQESQAIPDITPMRRGRLPAAQPGQQAHKPSPSPGRVTSGDPFAALDTKTSHHGSQDEISTRFPSLDQFSLLHDHGAKFSFDSPTSPPSQQDDLSKKVTEHLADKAFARPQDDSPELGEQVLSPAVTPAVAPTYERASPSIRSPPQPADLTTTTPAPPKPSEMSRASAIITKNPELQAISAQSTQRYVSTATGASPPLGLDRARGSPIWRVPSSDRHRSTSLPRQPDSLPLRAMPDESQPSSARATISIQSIHARQPSSSRPSLEGSRPSAEYNAAGSFTKPSQRERPTSTHLDSSLDFLRERQNVSKASLSPLPSPRFQEKFPSSEPAPKEETNIESNVEFLRSIEESNAKKDRSSWHIKKSSISSPASGSKNVFAGKFGDAFKRFEHQPPPTARTPSPQKEFDRRDLTPIAGSEATDGRSDDGNDLSPEKRREMERLQLEEEERRVEAAQVEYRQRKAGQGQSGARPAPPPKPAGGSSRAISIQNRMQSLLDESQKVPVTRTAQGYGVYSDAAHASSHVDKQLPEIPRKPITTKPRPVSQANDAIVVSKLRHPNTEPLPGGRSAIAGKPPAPRKPLHLNNIPTGNGTTASPPNHPSGLSSDRLVAVGLPNDQVLDMTPREKDDYLADFSKRFPSLSAIEMVETDIDADVNTGGGSSR